MGGGNCYALNLARYLLNKGHEVTGIGRSALKGPEFTLGVQEMGYEYHVLSVGPDTEFILDLIWEKDPDVIVNFAAQGEGQASFYPIRNQKYFYRTNTLALIELVGELDDFEGRFIQIGTSELYGSVGVSVNEDAPIKPSSPYAVSKAAFDLHLKAISKAQDFPAIIVRPSNAYCEGQQLHRIIPKTFLTALRGEKIPLYGGGVARKSYLHADDLSEAIDLIIEKGEVGEIYNVGPDEPVSIKRIVEIVAQCLGMTPTSIYEEKDSRVGEDSCYWLDSSKVKTLGWRQQINLTGGISKIHGWIDNYYPTLSQMSTDFKIRA